MAGVPVRGRCPAGHEFTETAPAGRVTWHGPCPTCGLRTIARRIPRAEAAAAPAGTLATDRTSSTAEYPFVRLDRFNEPTDTPRARREPVEHPDDDHRAEPENQDHDGHADAGAGTGTRDDLDRGQPAGRPDRYDRPFHPLTGRR